jgi:hypothetical protein
MTHALDYPAHPPLDEATARSHAAELRALAAAHGITNLRFASTGRLLGHLEPDRDMDDMADFELSAEARLGRSFFLISDRVLSKPGVNPDLSAATRL